MIKTYTKTICVKVMDIAFKISIMFAVVGFISKFAKGTEGEKLAKSMAPIEIFRGALALNSDSLFTIAAYTVCITPFVLAVAIGVGYCAEKRPKDALLGVLLLAALMMAFVIQR